MASVHDKLERVRKPRVHIKYEVETEGAMVVRELPFVVGVLGDFSGNAPGEPLKPLKDRKFVQIDRDNFDQVMSRIKPGVSLRVRNTLDESAGTELAVNLGFERMEDFEPSRIVEQVPALKELKDVRDKLFELLNKADRSEELEALLEKVLQESDARASMARDLDIGDQGSEEGR